MLDIDSYSTIVSDLRALGYSSTYAKYWIYYDASVGYCGQGGVLSDTRPSADNGNNRGPSYGISYACNAMMHENGHNLGAVQHNAPNASGGWHCNDGQDVMCYADGGPTSRYNPSVCSTKHYDCNHNDYFHPNPPSGNYLATNWNIGACYNRFIQRSGCGGTNPTATRTRTPTFGTGPTPTRTRTRTATSGTGTYPAWAPGVFYATGARVSYGGANYQCLQAHTSQTGWEPPNAPALWQRI